MAESEKARLRKVSGLYFVRRLRKPGESDDSGRV
jgi:hypothetical protein